MYNGNHGALWPAQRFSLWFPSCICKDLYDRILVRFLYRILPDMPGHYLYMRLTESALIQMRTMLANSRVALVFPVSIPVRRTVTENFICRAKIAVKEFVIDIFVLEKKAIFRLGAGVGAQEVNAVLFHLLCYGRRLVSSAVIIGICATYVWFLASKMAGSDTTVVSFPAGCGIRCLIFRGHLAFGSLADPSPLSSPGALQG